MLNDEGDETDIDPAPFASIQSDRPVIPFIDIRALVPILPLFALYHSPPYEFISRFIRCPHYFILVQRRLPYDCVLASETDRSPHRHKILVFWELGICNEPYIATLETGQVHDVKKICKKR